MIQRASVGLLSLVSCLGYCELTIKPDKTSVVSSAKPVTLAPSIGTADFLQVFLGLVVVVATVVLVLWVIRRLGRYSSSANNHIKILGGVNLGARERLLVVQVGEQQLVLGIAPGSIRTLHVLEHPLVVEVGPDKFALLLTDRLRHIFKAGDKK